MGNFNDIYTFISNRVLHIADDNNTTNKENFSPRLQHQHHRRHFSDSAPASAQQLFPCEDKHSFNPHYQHNLCSSSFYSTPPSLSSSPTNSSPSSTTSSSSSHSSLQRPYSQNTHPRNARHQYLQQLKQSQQQMMPQQQHQQHQRNRSYSSYGRQQGRRQNYRCLADQHFEYMDDDLMIGYDNQHIYYGSGSSTSMGRVHPHGSPSYTFGSSVPSVMDRHHLQDQQQRRRTSHISASASRASETERASPAFRSLSAASVAHGMSSHKSTNPNHIHSGHQWLPCISETSATMYMHVHNGNGHDDQGLDEESNAATLGPRLSSTTASASTPSTTSAPESARQSLMRISRCDLRQDGWCSQRAGQWTRHYAEARPIGLVADGRRARRL